MRTVRIEHYPARACGHLRDEQGGTRANERHPGRQDGIAFDRQSEERDGEIGQKTVGRLASHKYRESHLSKRHGREDAATDEPG